MRVERDGGDPQYKISHLERQQSVTFRFIAASEKAVPWRPAPFNDEGDVEFVARDAQRAREDAEHGAPFLFWATLLVALPPALNGCFDFTDPVEALARLVLFGFLTPHLAPATRMIAAAIQRAGSAGGRDENIAVYGDNVLVAKGDGPVNIRDVNVGEDARARLGPDQNPAGAGAATASN